MNKAFIFDMDGVIIDSEKAWEKYENDFLDKLLGKKISAKIGSTTGVSVNTIYDKAKLLGFVMPRKRFQMIYDETAFRMYDIAEITLGIEELIAFLIGKNFKLGIVSSSATSWINKVLSRLSFADKFESKISLNERSNLKPKPDPDGYAESMKNLGSDARNTIILEDSNTGIAAAKASGAFTIAFTQNLMDGYKQIKADAKAKNMQEVIEVIRKFCGDS